MAEVMNSYGVCGADCHHEYRAQWPEGPWTHEPDRVDFEHAGLPCVLHRSPPGNWCGYVGVGREHPLYGKGYEDVSDLEVHGGLTYASRSDSRLNVLKVGEPVWWFGFDCGHWEDVVPAWLRFHLPFVENRVKVYRDIHYARRETERLAEQLADLQLIVPRAAVDPRGPT